MKNFWSLFILLTLSVFSVSCSKSDEGSSESGGGGTEPSSTWTNVTATPDSWDNSKRADITYEILVYSFADSNGDGIGDFKGIQDKLDYIDALGVDAIWLSPIHPADSYHGYDVTDYEAVNSLYGNMNDFDNLVTAAHAKGIKVYLDFVLNHTGKGHPWLKKAVDGESPYNNFYFLSSTSKSGYYPYTIAGLTSGKLKFVLDWSKKTVTVTETQSVDDAEGDGGIWLYFGNGTCKQFKKTADNTYELAVNYDSDWGFLIRTSNTSWDGGTKYGAVSGNQCKLGSAFNLTNNNPSDIVFSGTKTLYYYGAFGSYMPDLNYGNSAGVAGNTTFMTMVEAGSFWVKNHKIDGFRLDAVKHIYDAASDNVNFLKAWYSALNTVYQAQGKSDNIYMVGEALSDYTEVAPYYEGLPAMFDFSYWYTLKEALTNRSGSNLCSEFMKYKAAYKQKRSDYIDAIKLSNHDEDRTAYCLGGDVSKIKQAAAILLTSAGSPYIYYGEEVALNSQKSKDNNGDEYNRTPYPWGGSYETSGSKIYGKEISVSSDASVLDVYKSFAKLRNTYPALAIGAMSAFTDFTNTSLAAWYMKTDSQKVLVLHNLHSSSMDITVKDNINKVIGLLGTCQVKDNVYRLDGNSSLVLLLK